MQPLQAGGDRHLDPAPYRFFDMIELDVKKGDAFIRDHDANAAADLAAHKLHVAEAYATKAGLSEQTTQIMKAFASLGAKIDRTNERLDNMMSARAME